MNAMYSVCKVSSEVWDFCLPFSSLSEGTTKLLAKKMAQLKFLGA